MLHFVFISTFSLLSDHLIPSDVERDYWRDRAVMMDDRLDLANCQLFGADGHHWNDVYVAKAKHEEAFAITVRRVKSYCKAGIDEKALALEKVLRCEK